MSVQVVPAEKAQQPVLARLLELYIHDFSELQDVHLQADGTFGYPNLPLYWLDPDRRPFFIFLDDKLAGFILIQRGSEISSSPEVWDVAEFFILRRYRRQGIGADAAHRIWTRLPGPWEVRVNESNPAALHFWQHAISTFTNQPAAVRPVLRGGRICHHLSFISKGTL